MTSNLCFASTGLSKFTAHTLVLRHHYYFGLLICSNLNIHGLLGTVRTLPSWRCKPLIRISGETRSHISVGFSGKGSGGRPTLVRYSSSQESKTIVMSHCHAVVYKLLSRNQIRGPISGPGRPTDLFKRMRREITPHTTQV